MHLALGARAGQTDFAFRKVVRFEASPCIAEHPAGVARFLYLLQFAVPARAWVQCAAHHGKPVHGEAGAGAPGGAPRSNLAVVLGGKLHAGKSARSPQAQPMVSGRILAT